MKRLTHDAVLVLCDERGCQDRRDVIHGTLAIVDWKTLEVVMADGSWITDEDENMAVTPDYSISRYDLVKIVLPRL